MIDLSTTIWSLDRLTLIRWHAGSPLFLETRWAVPQTGNHPGRCPPGCGESQAACAPQLAEFSTTLDGPFHADPGGSSINGDVAHELASEVAEKQRFMSRIKNVANWADAANRECGWDFYPNNLTVRRRAPLSRVPGNVYGPAARTFEVVAHLDPGARDCAVYLIVPTDMTSITLELRIITADIDQRLFGGSAR